MSADKSRTRQFELLEVRYCLANQHNHSYGIDDGILTVEAIGAAYEGDILKVYAKDGKIIVEDGEDKPGLTPPRVKHIDTVLIDGLPADPEDVTGIVLRGRADIGAGNDTLDLSEANSFENLTEVDIDGKDGDDIIWLPKSDSKKKIGTSAADGGEGKDRIYGGSLNDSISGGEGDDILKGYKGNDTLDGDDGKDQIYTGSGHDAAHLGFDFDGGSIDATPDDGDVGDQKKTLIGSLGDDIIIGGEGPDVIEGWDGEDNLDGGDDRDEILGGPAIAFGDDQDKINGGDKDDIIWSNAWEYAIDRVTKIPMEPDQLPVGAGGRDLTDSGGPGCDLVDGVLDDECKMKAAVLDIMPTIEGDGVIVWFSLSQPITESVVLTFATANGNATTADSDYTGYTNGSVTFAPSETPPSTSFVIATGPDSTVEPDETFSVSVASVSSGKPDPERTVAKATILNNDSGSASLAVHVSDLLQIAESSSATFTVKLSTVAPGNVTVSYSTSAGTATTDDFSPTSGTVVIGSGYDSAQVVVPITNDAYYEPDESFGLVLTGLSGASAFLERSVALATIVDNDAAPSVAVSGGGHIAEGSSATFTIALSTSADHNITVDYRIADYDTTSNDLSAATGSVVFTPGQTTKSVSVAISTDADAEADESFYLQVTNASGGAVIDDAVEFGVIKADAPPLVNFTTPVKLIEGQSASFMIGLSWESTSDVTVFYETENDTGTSAGDYTAVTSSVVFTPGQTLKTVVVGTSADSSDEGNESFLLNLTSVTNAVLGYPSARAQIIDNDSPAGVLVSVLDASVAESSASASVTVSLSAQSGQNVTVYYETADRDATNGSDYSSVVGSVVFTAGETTKVVGVAIQQDSLDEDDEQFLFRITSAPDTDILDSEAEVTIADDDAVPTIGFSGSVSVTEGSSATISVTLSAASGRDVIANYAALSGGDAMPSLDFAANMGQVSFSAGQTVATIVIATVGDVLDEVDESFYVNILNAWNATATPQTTVTITDNDSAPSVTVGNASPNEGSSASFTISLAAESGKSVTVGYSTSHGTAGASDYTSAVSSVTFAPGETSKVVAVATTNDTLDEDDETFNFSLTAATNATLGTPSVGTATIADNDATPTIIVGDDSRTEGDSLTLTVTMNAESGRTVYVNYSCVDGTAVSASDYTATNVAVTFAPGETVKTVVVPTGNDSIDENNESFTLTLTGATNANISDGVGIGTIEDNDTAGVYVNLSQGGPRYENGGYATVTVSLSTSSASDITVYLQTYDGSASSGYDYYAPTGTDSTLVFTSGQTQKVIYIQLIDDYDHEGDESFTLSLTGAVGATIDDGFEVATIYDND